MEAMVNAIEKNDKVKYAIVCTTFPQRYGHMKDVPKVEIVGKSRIHRFYTPEHNNSFILQFFSYLIFGVSTVFFTLRNKNKFDVVFATSSRLGTGVLGYIVSKILKKKLALDIRDIFSDSLESLDFCKTILGKFFVKLVKKIETIICERSLWINFVSPGFLRYAHMSPAGKHICLFSNGIDDIFLQNKFENPGAFNNPMVITYAGNIGYGQGLEKTVIPIAEYFKEEVVFKLVGDGSSVKLIKKLIKKKSIKNIQIFKPVKRNKLLEIYNKSDVLFLQLNKVKAFEHVLPSKIFDYGSFHKPILAGVSGTAKNFLQKNFKNIYIYPPDNFVQAIQNIKKIKEDEKIEIDNSSFIDNYARKNIMKKMVESIYIKLSHE
tara:strand:- start:665 stop:1795 length:1131 start_codon:yes stop_codon:yes gene_type:complete